MVIDISNLINELQKIADEKIKNSNPIFEAILTNNLNKALAIVNEFKIKNKLKSLAELKTINENNVLLLAIKRKMPALALKLLEFQEFNPYEKDDEGYNALMLALKYDYQDVIKLIFNRLDLKQHIHDVNKKNQDAFNYAIQYCSNPKYADELLKLGVDLEKRDKEGHTRLMTALLKAPHHVIEYLKSRGANLNAKNNKGETALVIAVKNTQIHLVRYILEQGASINVTDGQGKSLEDILKATENKKEAEKIATLLKNSPQNNQPIDYTALFMNSLIKGDLENFAYIAKGVAPAKIRQILTDKHFSERNWRPVHLATSLGHLDILKFIFEQDEELLEIPDNQGNTLPHIAAMFGQLETLKFLKSIDLNINSQNNWHETPLIVAKKNNQLGVAKYIEDELLIEKKNKNKQTLNLPEGPLSREDFIETLKQEDGNNFEALHVKGLTIIAHHYAQRANHKFYPCYVADSVQSLKHALSILKNAKDLAYGLLVHLGGHSFAIKCERYKKQNFIIMMDSLGSEAPVLLALKYLNSINYSAFVESILPEIFSDQMHCTYFFKNKELRQTSNQVCSIFALKDIRKMMSINNFGLNLTESQGIECLSKFSKNSVTTYLYKTPELFMRLIQSPDKFDSYVKNEREIVKNKKNELMDKLSKMQDPENQCLITKLKEIDKMHDAYIKQIKKEFSQKKEELTQLQNQSGNDFAQQIIQYQNELADFQAELTQDETQYDKKMYLSKDNRFESLTEYALRSRNKYGVKTPMEIQNRNYHPVNNPNVPKVILKNNTIDYFRAKYVYIVDNVVKSCTQQNLQLLLRAYSAQRLIFTDQGHVYNPDQYQMVQSLHRQKEIKAREEALKEAKILFEMKQKFELQKRISLLKELSEDKISEDNSNSSSSSMFESSSNNQQGEKRKLNILLNEDANSNKDNESENSKNKRQKT